MLNNNNKGVQVYSNYGTMSSSSEKSFPELRLCEIRLGFRCIISRTIRIAHMMIIVIVKK